MFFRCYCNNIDKLCINEEEGFKLIIKSEWDMIVIVNKYYIQQNICFIRLLQQVDFLIGFSRHVLSTVSFECV